MTHISTTSTLGTTVLRKITSIRGKESEESTTLCFGPNTRPALVKCSATQVPRWDLWTEPPGPPWLQAVPTDPGCRPAQQTQSLRYPSRLTPETPGSTLPTGALVLGPTSLPGQPPETQMHGQPLNYPWHYFGPHSPRLQAFPNTRPASTALVIG